MSNPHFIIKNNFQKGGTYKALLKPSILSDVCRRLTGKSKYTVTWDSDGYNKGRMAILEHDGRADYISFSEIVNEGRNSFFQSVPSALNQCILASGKKARPYYYFLPIEGAYQSAYYCFMYRLLRTVGVRFLNENDYLDERVMPFVSVEDMLRARDDNRGRNRSNNSTYMTLTKESVQIFAKVYGANKYESELFALASQQLSKNKIELFEIKEGNLTELPDASKKVLEKVCGKQLELIVGDMTLERNEFEKGDSLRSPRYVYNLLERLGPKKCALCACDIPVMIQGAHIWGVSQIKHEASLTADEKLNHAQKYLAKLSGETIVSVAGSSHIGKVSFGVTMPSGVTISRRKGSETFAETIRQLGAAEIAEKFPGIVKKDKSEFPSYASVKDIGDGWFVNVHGSTKELIRVLKKIRACMDCGIEIIEA